MINIKMLQRLMEEITEKEVNMRTKELIDTMKHALRIEEVNCKNRKNNINSHYELAKHDFRVIDNMEDCIETYRYVIEKLEDLQDRIIERNKERLF